MPKVNLYVYETHHQADTLVSLEQGLVRKYERRFLLHKILAHWTGATPYILARRSKSGDKPNIIPQSGFIHLGDIV